MKSPIQKLKIWLNTAYPSVQVFSTFNNRNYFGGNDGVIQFEMDPYGICFIGGDTCEYSEIDRIKNICRELWGPARKIKNV